LFTGHKVAKIILTDMQGRRIRTWVSSTLLNIVLDVQDVSNGVYILSFYDTDGNIVENSKVKKNTNQNYTVRAYSDSIN
jgi:hypothetical protein